MSNWRAIVFDLDDTLYLERDYVFSGFRAVASWAAKPLAIPVEQGYAELVDLFTAGVRGDTFDRWLAGHRQPPSLVPQLVDVYRQHEPVLRPLPGIPALLASLRRQVALGLVSDGYLEVQRRKLAALGLAHYFDAIVFSDQWGREAWKPSLRPFTIVTELLAVTGSEAVYIADNPAKDFLGARQAGLHTIWLRHSGGDYVDQAPPTAAHAADIVVDSLALLSNVLRPHLGRFAL